MSRIFNYSSIVAPRGMLSAGSMSTRFYRKKFYLVLARYTGLFSNTVFHATSKHEMGDIKKHFGSSVSIKYAANLPGNVVEPIFKDSKSKGCIKLVIIARVSPEKNIAFALEVLKGVKGKVELNLFGSIYDNNYWENCLDIIESLPENVYVNYQESIEPAKIKETLRAGDFLILPSTGENFGHIIFESFAVGTPVIISDQTPWRNLDKEKIGWDIPLSNREKFIDTIEFVFENG
jgi:glycosyltransferase involved in cell wall biosynthesis